MSRSRTPRSGAARPRAGRHRREDFRLGSSVLVVVAALIATSAPELFALDRAELLEGELWRLWTGHLVHASPAHFAFDVGAAAVLVGIGGGAAWLALAPLLGLAVLVTCPELAGYVGLSGVLHGAAVLAAARVARRSRSRSQSQSQSRGTRAVAWALAVGALAKAAVEAALAAPLFTATYDMGGATVFQAHLLGAGLGWASLGWAWAWAGLGRGLRGPRGWYARQDSNL